MSFSFTLINLAGTIVLLLWGTHMVQTGIQRAFGAELRAVLGSSLRNRVSAFLAGIGVTAILQSSTATGLMTAGFAAGGMVDLVPALAVMSATHQAPGADHEPRASQPPAAPGRQHLSLTEVPRYR